MGKECLKIFLNLNFGTEELRITSALKALDTYFLPKKNVVYERYVFNSCSCKGSSRNAKAYIQEGTF